MDHHHHIIATDLLTHWAESTGTATMEQQQQPGDEQHNKAALVQPQISSLHGGAGPTAEELLVKQKSRRSLTEAERGLTAEPNALRPPTTKAGKHRIRMKWSTETNEFIMRTYYTITSNETQTKSYRDHLHRLFAIQYPDVAISQQRIADQRRAIVKNNLLPKAVLDAIKDEVAVSLQMKSPPHLPGTPIITTNPSSSSTVTAIKQEIPTAHIVTGHHIPQLTKTNHVPQQSQQQQHQLHTHHQQQQQAPHHQQQQQQHLLHHHHQHHAIAMHQTPSNSLHQAITTTSSPTSTATALQSQPHIIIRVNSTNPHGGAAASALKHHFVGDGSSI